MHISPWFAGRKEKSMKYLNKVVEIILEVLVAGMVLGCCWQVITRFVLHNPSKYTEELLRYMLIWLTMMGVPYAYGQNSHLAINLKHSVNNHENSTYRNTYIIDLHRNLHSW